MSEKALIRDLKESSESINRLLANLDDARYARATLFKKASDAGMTQSLIAEIAGVSIETVRGDLRSIRRT